MKYMGSKRELLEQIERIVDKKITKNKAFLDLFSGTCGVGIYLRDKYPIYSNDIQFYSKAISEGTIEAFPLNIPKDKIWHMLEKNYNKNFNFVSGKLAKYFSESNYYKNIKRWDEIELKKYLEFIKSLPSPVNNNATKSEGKWLSKEYKSKKANRNSFPYIQTTYLFSEMYFSIEQAIAIDSLKYSIDCLRKKDVKLSKILNVALIHSFSYTSAGTGHFAQFRDLSTISSVTDVFLYRTKSVLDYFFRKTEELLESAKTNINHSESKSFSSDYRDLLDNENIMENTGIIYADPPYSFVHYSRFYHAIENLCRYDYPLVEHKGRYRTDRHQSPFCIKTQAPNAFREIFLKAIKYKIPVLISYSNTGMIQLDEIKKIAKEFGYKISLSELDHKHSTMGRLKDKNRDVKEALLICYL